MRIFKVFSLEIIDGSRLILYSHQVDDVYSTIDERYRSEITNDREFYS